MKIAILGRGPEGRFPENAAKLQEAASKSGATLCYFDPREGLPEGTDVLLTLGGDGTFLSSLPCVRDSGIPVVGINLGRLGFLTAAEADSAAEALAAIIRGDYSVRERSLLMVTPEEASLPEGFRYPSPASGGRWWPSPSRSIRGGCPFSGPTVWWWPRPPAAPPGR